MEEQLSPRAVFGYTIKKNDFISDELIMIGQNMTSHILFRFFLFLWGFLEKRAVMSICLFEAGRPFYCVTLLWGLVVQCTWRLLLAVFRTSPRTQKKQALLPFNFTAILQCLTSHYPNFNDLHRQHSKKTIYDLCECKFLSL